MEFKAVARKDAFQRMESELAVLLDTAPEERRVVRQPRNLSAIVFSFSFS